MIREHALTSLTPIGRRHLLTIAGSANEEETNQNGEPPSMYRRPACPVNDKREANRFHTRRKRGNRVEEIGSFTTGGRWTEKTCLFHRESFGAQQAGSSGQPKFVSTLTNGRFSGICARSTSTGSTNVFKRRRHEEQTGTHVRRRRYSEGCTRASCFNMRNWSSRDGTSLPRTQKRLSKRHSAWDWCAGRTGHGSRRVRHLFSA